MADLALQLDPVSQNLNDLDLVDGDLRLTSTTIEDVRQNILQRLRVYLGEWFLDNTIGVPYYQQILVKNPDQSKIDAIYINQIMGTRGVQQLNSYSFSPNLTTRVLNLAFSAQTVKGKVDYQGALKV